jgi:hypothetical protein
MTLNIHDDLSLCNAALNIIGVKPIDSISDPVTDKEATCARLYPIVIGGLLSRFGWNHVNKVVQLAQSPDEPKIGNYTYAHKLPSAMIAGPFAVYADGNLAQPFQEYEISNDHVHSDYARVDVLHRRGGIVSTWPLYFVELAVYALAAAFAKPVADSSSMSTEMRIRAFGDAGENMEGGLFKAAKSIEAQSRPTKTFFRNGDPLTVTVR